MFHSTFIHMSRLISICNLNYQCLMGIAVYRLHRHSQGKDQIVESTITRRVAHIVARQVAPRSAMLRESKRGCNRYARPRVGKLKRISDDDDDDDDDGGKDEGTRLARDGRSRRLCNAIIDSGGVQRRRKEQHRFAVLVPTYTRTRTPRRPYRGASR